QEHATLEKNIWDIRRGWSGGGGQGGENNGKKGGEGRGLGVFFFVFFQRVSELVTEYFLKQIFSSFLLIMYNKGCKIKYNRGKIECVFFDWRLYTVLFPKYDVLMIFHYTKFIVCLMIKIWFEICEDELIDIGWTICTCLNILKG
ncbi:hypothetical protein ACJX0J_017235, partial [Zea mays]